MGRPLNERRLRTRCRLTLLTLAAVCILSTPLFAHPGSGIAVDQHGQVYFLDTGSGLWKIDGQGNLNQLSKTLFHWLAIDADNRFANSPLPKGAAAEIQTVGANPAVLLASEWPIAIGQDGNLYYQSGRRGSLKVTRMTPSGSTSVFATLPPPSLSSAATCMCLNICTRIRTFGGNGCLASGS